MDLRSIRLISLALILAAIGYVAACGGESPTEPEPPGPTVLKVVVSSDTDGSFLTNSNVVLYQASSREAVHRDLTDESGAAYFRPTSDDYYVHVSAQGYEASPPPQIQAIPFFVTAADTTVQEISLLDHQGVGDSGYLYGVVEPALSNFLITAESTQEKYFTSSGPDGVFLVYNLPFGDYDVDALKAGYALTSPVGATIGLGAEVDSVIVQVNEYVGSDLDGSITFLASENSIVDVTLLDPRTRAVVPGLSTLCESSSLDYLIQSIPDGNYLAWASLRNDGYVLDPDWLFKNPGGLDVAFATAGAQQLNFSVTDAIPITSPTNSPDNTVPAIASSPVPTFSWSAYPSTTEYIIEVRDLNGRVLWGGFEADGTVNHAFIGRNDLSVDYNFDNQPGVPALEPGRIYQWRLWADKGTQLDSTVEQLISASEDLLGLFQVPEIGPAAK